MRTSREWVPFAAWIQQQERAGKAQANLLRPRMYKEQCWPLNDSQGQWRLTKMQGADRSSQLCEGSSDCEGNRLKGPCRQRNGRFEG